MDKVIGLDIGGTSVKGAIVGRDGTIFETAICLTRPEAGRELLLQRMEVLMYKLLSGQPDGTIHAIGIASAGRVNFGNGEVVYATENLPGWQGVQLKQWAESVFGLPTIVDNDANAALLGEIWLGSGSPQEELVMLTLGTGVGGAYSLHGRPVRGKRWYGGEWGHSILVPGGMPCNCGKKGCAEQYISGMALHRRGRESADKIYPSAHDLIKGAEAGEEEALRVLKGFVSDLAVVIVNIGITLDPDAVIVGGGLIDSSDVWWPLLERQMGQWDATLEIRRAALGNRAGYLGAANLALDVSNSCI